MKGQCVFCVAPGLKCLRAIFCYSICLCLKTLDWHQLGEINAVNLLPPFSSPWLPLVIQTSSGPRVAGQYKQTHRLLGKADKSLEFHYPSPHCLPGGVAPQVLEIDLQNNWLIQCLFSAEHTHAAFSIQLPSIDFPVTYLSKFIMGDKGLPFPLPLKKNLYRTKIRQSPPCNESDPWRVWVAQWEGTCSYEPALIWRGGTWEVSGGEW